MKRSVICLGFPTVGKFEIFIKIHYFCNLSEKAIQQDNHYTPTATRPEVCGDAESRNASENTLTERNTARRK